jgi:hypothetical protein
MIDIVPIAAVTAVAGYWIWSVKDNKARDYPPLCYFRMPPPRLYATVKKVIMGYRVGEYHFQLVECDPTTLTIRAACEWRDRTYRTMPAIAPQGYVFSQVILDVAVGLDRSGDSYLQLTWLVLDGPFRAKGNLLQAALTRTIFDALATKVAEPDYQQKGN